MIKFKIYIKHILENMFLNVGCLGWRDGGDDVRCRPKEKTVVIQKRKNKKHNTIN